ncbi:MAG: chemotaxis protein CheW [Verrucomicrobia bacterium]|nr:chemotaxis protein CheW [Verrucomicrobiota bacterium]
MLFLLFQLGADRYALPAAEVAEVLPLVALKGVPGAPAGVAGLIDYRGTAVPVIDLCALALGRAAARRVSTRVLMVRHPLARGDGRLLGVIVERATETLARAPGDFQATGLAGEGARYLGPVVHDPRGLIQRVEIGALLTPALRAALFPPETEAVR